MITFGTTLGIRASGAFDLGESGSTMGSRQSAFRAPQNEPERRELVANRPTAAGDRLSPVVDKAWDNSAGPLLVGDWAKLLV